MKIRHVKLPDVNRRRYIENNPPEYTEGIRPWTSVFFKNWQNTSFYKDDQVFIRQSNSRIDSLLCVVYSFGVNLDPVYQRGIVWNDEEKHNLIDSIYNKVEIGRFLLRRLPIQTRGFLYEIVGGKQRLSTILEFYEDRFFYNGYKFSEISGGDKHRFLNAPVLMSEIEDVTDEQTMLIFKKINKTSKPIEEAHFKKIDEMLAKLRGEQ